MNTKNVEPANAFMLHQKQPLIHARPYAQVSILLMGLTKRDHTPQHAKNKNTELPHQKQPCASCNAQVAIHLTNGPWEISL